MSLITAGELSRRRPRARSEERRLGVRRALDLSGSTVTAYSPSGSFSKGQATTYTDLLDEHATGDSDDDEEDEFKATVVLEQMIRAADVGALLQDWNNFTTWATRLYKELKNSSIQKRGEDPSVEWYEGQIKFIDYYILPLAKNLGVMGVFKDSGLGNGGGGEAAYFVNCVKSNLARWIEEGRRTTQLMMKEDKEERGMDRDLA